MTARWCARRTYGCFCCRGKGKSASFRKCISCCILQYFCTHVLSFRELQWQRGRDENHALGWKNESPHSGILLDCFRSIVFYPLSPWLDLSPPSCILASRFSRFKSVFPRYLWHSAPASMIYAWFTPCFHCPLLIPFILGYISLSFWIHTTFYKKIIIFGTSPGSLLIRSHIFKTCRNM